MTASVNPLQPLPSPVSGPVGPTSPATPAPAASRFTPVDPLRFLRQHWLLLVLSAVVGLVLGTVLHNVFRLYAPGYTSVAYLQAVGAASAVFEQPGSPERPSQVGTDAMSAFIQNQVNRIRSDSVITQALSHPDVRKTAWFQSLDRNPATAADKAKHKMLKRGYLGAEHLRGSDYIVVSMRGPTDKGLQDIVNVVVETYFNALQRESDEYSEKFRRVYVAERGRADSEASRLQDQLRAFAKDHDLPNLKNNLHEVQISLSILADEEVRILVNFQGAQSALTALLAQQEAGTAIHTSDDEAEVDRDPAVFNRKERLRLLRVERSVMLERFDEKHRMIKDLDVRTAGEELELKTERGRLLREREAVQVELARKRVDGLKAQLEALQGRLGDVRNRMKDLNVKIQEFENLQEQAKLARERKAKSDDALMLERIAPQLPDYLRVQKVQSAVEPEQTFPRWYLVVPGTTLLVMVLAGGLVFLRDTLDQRVKTAADLRLLPHLDLLGVLPEVGEDPSAGGNIAGVVQRVPGGLMSEAFRQTRTAILSRMDRRGLKTLLLVGAGSQAGVSSVASNLALSLAQNGRRVLVLDANLRRPAQHALLNSRLEPGLVDVLRGRVNVDDAIVHKPDLGLDVLPAGTQREATPELLEGQGFRGLLGLLEGRYDLIVIDAAPSLVTSDAQMLVRHVDGVAIVVRAQRGKRGMVSRTLRQLQGQRAEVLGVVLNGARPTAGGYFRENFRDFHRYGGAAPAATVPGPAATP